MVSGEDHAIRFFTHYSLLTTDHSLFNVETDMALNDLTTLAAVKTWLGRSGDTNSDAQFASLIASSSRAIYTYLRRGSILPRTIAETRNGTGTQEIILRAWPALSVSSLIVDNQSVPQSPPMTGSAAPSSGETPFGGARQPGWMLEAWDGLPPGRPQALSLSGYSFGLALPAARNFQDVQIVYQAGYQVTNEAQTIASGQATVNAPYGAWASDMGVTYANGTPLTKVASNPAVGQYALGASAGTYDFNADDDGQGVLISYGFIPSDLADACIELLSERYKYSQRIGETTHSLGGNETVGFDNARLTPLVMSMLQPYRSELPL